MNDKDYVKLLQENIKKVENKKAIFELLQDFTRILGWGSGFGILPGVAVVSFGNFNPLYHLAVIGLGSAGMYGFNKLSNYITKKPIAEQEEILNNIFEILKEKEAEKEQSKVKRQRVEMQFEPTPKKTTTNDATKPKYSYDSGNLINVNVAEEPVMSSGGPDIPSYLTGRR